MFPRKPLIFLIEVSHAIPTQYWNIRLKPIMGPKKFIIYVMGRVTRLGGLPGLPGRVTLSAGVTICPADIFNYSNYFYRINFSFYFCFLFFNCILLSVIHHIHEPLARIHRST